MTTTLADRRTRIAALDYDYASQPRQQVGACNLCGSATFVVLTHRDRYGYPAEAHGCRRCGLVFLNPVMTADAYGSFYVGTYRPLVSAYHGRLIDARTIQAEQRDYAVERGDFLAPFLATRKGTRFLDIGGSTGVVAHEWAKRFGLQATVLDPAPLETAQAQALGLETIEGLVERHNFGASRFDVIALCQTVDHLLDVMGTLRRVRELIMDEGLLFIDIVDFRAAYLRNWSVEEAIKIDHPYYFVEFTITAYLERCGFEILRADYAADHLHVGYVCRPVRGRVDALPPRESVDAFWREIRHVQNAQADVSHGPVLGIIPARGGSKGLPGKNLMPLAGQSLVARAAAAARDSGVVDRVILTTDSPAIADEGRRAGIDVPFMRPPALAGDDTPLLPVLRHAIEALEADGWMPEIIVLLQPTSPLRQPAHLRDAVTRLRESRADSVVSVVEVPRHLSPDYVMRVVDEELKPFLPEGERTTRRQDARLAYVRDGTVYAFWRDTLMRHDSIYGSRCLPLIIPAEESVTIDVPADWAAAERLLQERGAR